MSGSLLNTITLAVMAGVGASLRPALLKAVHWICEKAPAGSRLRRVLAGGRAYGWIAALLAVGFFFHVIASTAP